MVTIDDFIGIWYLSGDRTKPCHISLEEDGIHLTVSLGDTNYPGYSFNGNNEIYRGGYPTGIISSDLTRIDWTFVEAFWER
jgi:hypothetical protein